MGFFDYMARKQRAYDMFISKVQCFLAKLIAAVRTKRQEMEQISCTRDAIITDFPAVPERPHPIFMHIPPLIK